MQECLLHTIPNGCHTIDEQVRIACTETIRVVREYMSAQPQSELHRQGKMFGILVVESDRAASASTSPYPGVYYLRAFSAMLDGKYKHPGFVPPVYLPPSLPVGHTREESRRLQTMMFANYSMLNKYGERRNLLDIFAGEKPILSREEWFEGKKVSVKAGGEATLPPSGTGECCGPKLVQYALLQHLRPVKMAEFWLGAPPRDELRREGCFYMPCSGKCRPVLRWMLGDEYTKMVYTGHNEEQKGQERKVEIIYEDEWLLVVNKQPGQLSVPGKTGELSIEEQLIQARSGNYIRATHRLDQDTSGLLVLAKNQIVYKALQSYFQRRDILKRYEAVCCLVNTDGMNGVEMRSDEGNISLPLLPDPYDRPRQMVDYAHGKVAQTHYRIREYRQNGMLLVDFFPRTGRTHQLRIHAAHPMGLNAPVAGDRLYGKGYEKFGRLMLHAAEIRFIHPVTGKDMHFCIPSGF